ncbi:MULTISPECIES: aa3-type cytochrome c oxidase subunit IV [unclassified Novosphingobium]|nr:MULTISPECIES: aa3-type cytochrome c oxidase subunit IV [unclassified Novosphingobium]MBN9143836.1 aa3-type cytochrome c oxidase subunit IV [Novosphingobium sp.]MBN9271073.1 aa3-type cytochrome c oxidase subunit IV [Mesorhizobium sp.]MDR6707022.1 tRNA threonylcarbamoyladenosine modification (KEOPS) complex Pcc1 subunit [Novosphingobium sp. 1748]NKJ02120.1 tRNA threonylcarbamoyladenosine modification (KEOPS) complex Pcc1 subunit [Novosphingobium sp. SG707]
MTHTQDITAARQTYEGFIRLIKVSTPVIAIVAAFVVYLISR